MAPPPKNFKQNLDEFFFIENDKFAICLFCYKKINDFKKDRLRQHFNSFHQNKIIGSNADQQNELLNEQKTEYKENFGENQPNENNEIQRVQRLVFNLSHTVKVNSLKNVQSIYLKPLNKMLHLSLFNKFHFLVELFIVELKKYHCKFNQNFKKKFKMLYIIY